MGTVRLTSHCSVIHQWIRILGVLLLRPYPWCLPFAASSVSGSSSFVCSFCCVIHHWILGVFRLLLHLSVDPHPSVLRLLRHPSVDPWCLTFAASSVNGSSFFVCFVCCVIHQWIRGVFRLLLHPSVDP